MVKNGTLASFWHSCLLPARNCHFPEPTGLKAYYRRQERSSNTNTYCVSCMSECVCVYVCVCTCVCVCERVFVCVCTYECVTKRCVYSQQPRYNMRLMRRFDLASLESTASERSDIRSIDFVCASSEWPISRPISFSCPTIFDRSSRSSS